MWSEIRKSREKTPPEKLNVFRGFLAHLPGFEPGTFRLGGQEKSNTMQYEFTRIVSKMLDLSAIFECPFLIEAENTRIISVCSKILCSKYAVNYVSIAEGLMF